MIIFLHHNFRVHKQFDFKLKCKLLRTTVQFVSIFFSNTVFQICMSIDVDQTYKIVKFSKIVLVIKEVHVQI